MPATIEEFTERMAQAAESHLQLQKRYNQVRLQLAELEFMRSMSMDSAEAMSTIFEHPLTAEMVEYWKRLGVSQTALEKAWRAGREFVARNR